MLAWVSSYWSFALGLGKRRHGHDCDEHDRPATIAETVTAKAAVEEMGLIKTLVYPNPARDRITVQNPDPEKYSQELIYDIRGHQLSQQYFSGNSASFDLTRMSSGIYLVVLRSAKGAPDQTKTFSIKR